MRLSDGGASCTCCSCQPSCHSDLRTLCTVMCTQPVLLCAIPWRAVLCCAVLCHPCHAVLCCVIHAMLCCAVLCCAVLCCAVLLCVLPQAVCKLRWSGVMPQGFLLGALSVLLVDGACRAPLLAAEPGLATLIKLCSRLPGYSQPWQGERRTLAARTLCSCIQRDSQVRRSIITSGGNVDGIHIMTNIAALHQRLQYACTRLIHTYPYHAVQPTCNSGCSNSLLTHMLQTPIFVDSDHIFRTLLVSELHVDSAIRFCMSANFCMKSKTRFHTAAGNNTLSITASFNASIIASNHARLHQKTGPLLSLLHRQFRTPEQFVGTQACVACCRIVASNHGPDAEDPRNRVRWWGHSSVLLHGCCPGRADSG